MLFSGIDGEGVAIDEATTALAGAFVDDLERKSQTPIPPRIKITAANPAQRITADLPSDAPTATAAFLRPRCSWNFAGSCACPAFSGERVTASTRATRFT